MEINIEEVDSGTLLRSIDPWANDLTFFNMPILVSTGGVIGAIPIIIELL